ncbi:MAG TPA: hypothetical protein VGO79_07385, partial [Thermoanaerobaculia bacterium]
MRAPRTFASALLLAAVFGAADAGASEPRTLAAGGRTRVYRLYAPRSLPRDKPAALVLVFHGGEG